MSAREVDAYMLNIHLCTYNQWVAYSVLTLCIFAGHVAVLYAIIKRKGTPADKLKL